MKEKQEKKYSDKAAVDVLLTAFPALADAIRDLQVNQDEVRVRSSLADCSVMDKTSIGTDFTEVYEWELEYDRRPIHWSILIFTETKEFIGCVGQKPGTPGTTRVRKFLWMKWGEAIHTGRVAFEETVAEALKRLDQDNKAYYLIGVGGEYKRYYGSRDYGCASHKPVVMVSTPWGGAKTIQDGIRAEREDAAKGLKLKS